MLVNLRRGSDLLLIAPLALFLSGMVLVPLVIAVLSSFGLTTVAPGLPGHFTLRGYQDFFDPSKPSLQALWFTFKVTTVTTLTSTSLGLGLALFMRFQGIRFNGMLSFILKMPLFMPYLVTAFVFWVLLYPKGYIGIILISCRRVFALDGRGPRARVRSFRNWHHHMRLLDAVPLCIRHHPWPAADA